MVVIFLMCGWWAGFVLEAPRSPLAGLLPLQGELPRGSTGSAQEAGSGVGGKPGHDGRLVPLGLAAPARAAAAAAGGRGEETEDRGCGSRARPGPAEGGGREQHRRGGASPVEAASAGGWGPARGRAYTKTLGCRHPFPSPFPPQGRFPSSLPQGFAAQCRWLAAVQGCVLEWQDMG